MTTLSEITILVSGPRGTSLQKEYKKWLKNSKLERVTLNSIPQPKQLSYRSNCPVDLLRLRCPAQKGLLTKITDGLRLESEKLPNQEKRGIWLRLPRTEAILLGPKSRPVVDRLLKLNREKTGENCSFKDEEYIKLSVAAYSGETGIKKYKEGRNLGLSPEKAAQEAINASNPLEQFHEVSFAF